MDLKIPDEFFSEEELKNTPNRFNRFTRDEIEEWLKYKLQIVSSMSGNNPIVDFEWLAFKPQNLSFYQTK